jgi:predicted DNA binding CopG/RHH family protein
MTGDMRFVSGRDIPDDERLRDPEGRPVDDTYVVRVVEEFHRETRGRKSLSRRPGKSPLLQVRVPTELEEAIRLAAQADGLPRADWIRQVLRRAAVRRLRKAS